MSIASLYQQYLGRSPDAGGLAHFQNALRSGATLSQIANTIKGSAEARSYASRSPAPAPTPAPAPRPAPAPAPRPAPAPAPAAPARNTTADRQTLTNFYKEYLGRDPEEAGLNYYQTLLGSGTPMDTVKLQIKGSEEGRAYAGKSLQATAKQYLGRELETAGLASFQNAIAGGASLGQAVIDISNSPEAKLYAQNQQEAKLETQRAEQRAFDQAGRDAIAAQNQAILDQQRAEMAQRMEIFKQQQAQAKLDAERQARQMQIAAAFGQKDPADVRFSRSAAEKNRLLTAGTSGTFGRENLRIKGLNIKPSKGSSMASMASSFA